MKSLVIVESPNKVSKIQNYLGSNYKVIATKGHMYELPVKQLGINMETFEPEYKPISRSKKTISDIRNLSKKASKVIIATDPDREGEAIGFHAAEITKHRNIERAMFNSITKDAINKAVQNPTNMDRNLYDAAKCRRVLDRLIGYKLSPIAYKSVGKGTSIGRCQTPTIGLVHEYNKLVNEQKPKMKILANAELKFSNITIMATKETEQKEDPGEYKDVEFFCDIAKYKPFTETAPKPFITSTIQQHMNRSHGWSPKMTMNTLQTLFTKGLITYIRTDSYSIDETFSNKVKSILKTKFAGYKKKASKGHVQEGHEAIRPVDPSKKSITGKPQEQMLYKIIHNYSMACHMYSAKGETQSITFKDSFDEEWQGKHKVYKEKGWKALFSEHLHTSRIKFNEDTDVEWTHIKFIERPEGLKHHWKTGDLLKKMEDTGIGRPSTYSSIFDNIVSKGMVEQTDVKYPFEREEITLSYDGTITKKKSAIEDRKCIIITEAGKKIINLANTYMNALLNPSFTSQMETRLDCVAKGEITGKSLVMEIWKVIQEIQNQCKTIGRTVSKKKILRDDTFDYTFGRSKFGYFCCRTNRESGDKKYENVKSGFSDKATIEDMKSMFIYPMTVTLTDGEQIQVCKGKYGMYVKHAGKNKKYRGKPPHLLSVDDWEEWLDK